MGVERVEEGIEGRRSGSPSGFEEEGSKTVGPRTGISMHTVECQVDFSLIKDISKMIKVKSTLGVEVFKIKPPVGGRELPRRLT